MSQTITEKPADQLAPLQAFVEESNLVLRMLRALAMRPALPMPASIDVAAEDTTAKATTAIRKRSEAIKRVYADANGGKIDPEIWTNLDRRFPPPSIQTKRVDTAELNGYAAQWKIGNPDLAGSVLENGGIRKIINSWFDRLDAAYSAAGDNETRNCLRVMASIMGPRESTDERVIIARARDPLAIFSDKFGAKLLEVERQLSALPVEATKISATPAEAIDDDPGPMAWKDPDKGTIYRFTGRGSVVYDLWMVLAKRRRRYTRDQLKELVPRWKESLSGDDTIDKHVNKLRHFWRDNQRADIADKITWAGGAVGYDIPVQS